MSFVFVLTLGTADFIALNYYTARFATPAYFYNFAMGTVTDATVYFETDPRWPQSQAEWLYSAPKGLRTMLKCAR